MNNSYYILAKEAIHIERLHICTWEFPDADSYIEFGLEFPYETFTSDALNVWLSAPFIKEEDEVKCLLENLSNRGKHSKKCTFYTLRFGCSFAAVNTIKPQLL